MSTTKVGDNLSDAPLTATQLKLLYIQYNTSTRSRTDCTVLVKIVFNSITWYHMSPVSVSPSPTALVRKAHASADTCPACAASIAPQTAGAGAGAGIGAEASEGRHSVKGRNRRETAMACQLQRGQFPRAVAVGWGGVLCSPDGTIGPFFPVRKYASVCFLN